MRRNRPCIHKRPSQRQVDICVYINVYAAMWVIVYVCFLDIVFTYVQLWSPAVFLWPSWCG